MAKKLIDKRTPEQKAEFFRAQQAAAVREIALNNGGTGDIRAGISTEEFKRRKRRRKIAKATKRKSRKGRY